MKWYNQFAKCAVCSHGFGKHSHGDQGKCLDCEAVDLQSMACPHFVAYGSAVEEPVPDWAITSYAKEVDPNPKGIDGWF